MALATVAPRRSISLPSWWLSVVGVVGLIVLWQIAGATLYSDSGVIPTPTAILRQMHDDGFDFYWTNAKATMSAAMWGWLYGNLLAIALALVVIIVPMFEKPLLQLGVASYCLPVVAIGSIFVIVFDGEQPKIVLAAMQVFFTTLVGAIVGLRSADKASLDVVHAYGGGRYKQLVKVRLRSSLPSLFAGLRIAAPAAVLGAIIAEYLGAERGLGVTMIASQQALMIERTWALCIVATLCAGVAYGITALVGRLLTPWAAKGER
jgi:ABC-type nitrate/sulfonate/bicarbonate transport system permease component